MISPQMRYRSAVHRRNPRQSHCCVSARRRHPGAGAGSDLPDDDRYLGRHRACQRHVALLLERNPRLTPADVRRILTASAKRLGPNEQFGAGLIDPAKALQLGRHDRLRLQRLCAADSCTHGSENNVTRGMMSACPNGDAKAAIARGPNRAMSG